MHKLIALVSYSLISVSGDRAALQDFYEMMKQEEKEGKKIVIDNCGSMVQIPAQYDDKFRRGELITICMEECSIVVHELEYGYRVWFYHTNDTEKAYRTLQEYNVKVRRSTLKGSPILSIHKLNWDERVENILERIVLED